MSFEKAENFLEVGHAGLEGVDHLGKSIGVAVRGDGNCYYTATTIGVLVSAASQRDGTGLQHILDKFRGALYDGGGHSAYNTLSGQLKVYRWGMDVDVVTATQPPMGTLYLFFLCCCGPLQDRDKSS